MESHWVLIIGRVRRSRDFSFFDSSPSKRVWISFPNVPPGRSAERLTLRHTWPWATFRLGWAFSSLGVCTRRKSRIAARIAGGLIVLCALPGFASAQDATWGGTASDLWNNAANWISTPPAVPTGTATFDSSAPPSARSITFSELSTSVGTLVFGAPGYAFAITNPVLPPSPSLSSNSLVITGRWHPGRQSGQCADVQCFLSAAPIRKHEHGWPGDFKRLQYRSHCLCWQ